MKKLLSIAVLASAVLLGGCAKGQVDKFVVDATSVIAKVNDYTKQFCSFQADVSVIKDLLTNLDNPTVDAGLYVGEIICGAIQRRSGAGAPVVRMGGKQIQITGKYQGRVSR